MSSKKFAYRRTFTLRVNLRLFYKLKYIAEAEGRSANKEIEQLIKKYIAEFEKENGEIVLNDNE